jgi:hypothetical protein
MEKHLLQPFSNSRSHCKEESLETCYRMDVFEEPLYSNGLENMWYLQEKAGKSD